MEEQTKEDIKILKILLIIISSILFFIIGTAIAFIIMVDKVYAEQQVPITCTIAWQKNASETETANCFNSEPNIGGYTTFFNLWQLYNNNYGSQTWHITTLIDLYVIDYNNNDGDFIQTPNIGFADSNGALTITNLSRTLDTQYVTCDDPNNCIRHRIFNISFDYTGVLNGSYAISFGSGNNRADCGWLIDNPSTCSSSYPRVHWLSTTASYSDGGRFDDISQDLNDQTTILNGAINDSTTSINSNNNNNTQSVINNNNTNTQSVINNNNTNTQNIINNQRELLGDCHKSKNLFAYGITAIDSTAQYRPGTYQRLNIIATDNVNVVKFTYKGGNYSLGYMTINGIDGMKSYNIKFRVKEKNVPYSPRIVKDTSYSNSNQLVLRIDGGNQSTALPSTDYFILAEIMVSEENIPFEPYGETICTSKIDKAIDEIMGQGLTEEEKEEPDDQGITDYKNSEQQLKNAMDTEAINNVNIEINNNSNNWIWTTISRLTIEASNYIRLMIISILSIGVIKLVFKR